MASKHLEVDSASKSFYSHGNSLDTGGKSGVILTSWKREKFCHCRSQSW